MNQMAQELDEIGKFRDAVGHSRRPGLLDRLMFMLSRVHWRVALVVGILSAGVWGGVLGYQNLRASRSDDPLKDAPPAQYGAPVEPGETLPIPALGTNAPGKR